MKFAEKIIEALKKRIVPLYGKIRNGTVGQIRRLELLTIRWSRNSARVWLIAWILGLLLLWLWDFLFLNDPERRLLELAFVHSMFIASLVVALTFLLAWATTLLFQTLEDRRQTTALNVLIFLTNFIRSVPQIIGVLLGYVWITFLMERGSLETTLAIMLLMSVFLSLFIFLEVVDMLRERIAYFRQLDFYNAMRVCGISEWRIINYDILWKNSRTHILNKMIAVFSSAIFLQCSVDFIISVGLSTRVSSVNLPVTLGSLLANIDSKQDILAIGYSLTHPDYLPNLLFLHLQGISVAFVIVFTLFSLFKITNALAERFKL
ncbi:MAG: ABC transporter permease subunit [Calditrichaeota bacterium]|nr:ABC transporter permease subunit [Calditrichota bacterium]